MGLFKKVCLHNYVVKERSNTLQQDEMGYLLRLCICQCSKCGKSEQKWLDTNESALNEIKTGKSFLVKWDR